MLETAVAVYCKVYCSLSLERLRKISSDSTACFLTEIATRHSIIQSRCAKYCTTAVDLVVC